MFENPSLKIDGFGRTYQTHADGAPVVCAAVQLLCLQFENHESIVVKRTELAGYGFIGQFTK